MTKQELQNKNFEEVVFWSRMLCKQRSEGVRTSMIAAAFTAWLSGAGGERVSFNTYITKLGLEENQPKISTEKRRTLASEAYKKADLIIDKFRRANAKVI